MRAMAFAAFATAAAGATPALAQGAFFATLAQPAPAGRVVARETLWTCAGAECRAPRAGTSSDMTECRGMARKLGRVASFIAGETAFDPAQIERCNAGIPN